MGLLRYILGGDRPSQTAHLALFRSRIHGNRLEQPCHEGGISRMAPQELALPLQSLPPILHTWHRGPILGCSKGPRGLSVLLRVRGIFTSATVSPSLWLRQCPSRYAIRAGRNLPDKELRYLRTVIVTAAIHRGLSHELRPEGLTHSVDLPALGRRQSLYVAYTTLQRPVFLVNSRLGRFSVAPSNSSARLYLPGAPLLPKLRGQFAEFLNHNSLERLGLLAPPTCVSFGYGRNQYCLEDFSRDPSCPLRHAFGLGITSRAWCCGFACSSPSGLHTHDYRCAGTRDPVPPSVIVH